MTQRYKTFTADDIVELIGRINDGTEDRFCRDTVWTPGDEIVCRKEIENCEACLKEWLEEEIESEPTDFKETLYRICQEHYERGIRVGQVMGMLTKDAINELEEDTKA